MCALSNKKSFAGLDSIQVDGVLAFAVLDETTDKFCELGRC